jgi:MFS transporter, PPP family, 3-phenylpropionic acid transporter
MLRASLYTRLSGFYFWYFAFIGAFAPYFALYLQRLGYSAIEIAVLIAINPISRIYGPNLWGWLADHYHVRGAIIRWCAVLTAVIFAGVLFEPGFLGMLLLLALLNLFWSGILPLAEAGTMALLGECIGTYGRIRLWGSVGFVVVVIAGGYLLDAFGIAVLAPAVLVLLVITAATTFALPRDRSMTRRAEQVSIGTVLRQPGVAALLAGFFLMQVAHGPYNTFFSIYLVDTGHSKKVVGWLWAIGVLAEIALFVWLPRLMKRFSLERILAASFASAALRFLLIAWGVQWLSLLVVAQLMHAITFGAFHAAGVAAMHRIFRGRNQARGQAIYTSLGYGAGGTLGTLASGYAWEHFGGAVTFSLAGLAAVAALLVFRRYSPLR